MIQSGLLAGYLVLWGAMGLAPLDSQNWVLSSILPLTFVGAGRFAELSMSRQDAIASLQKCCRSVTILQHD